MDGYFRELTIPGVKGSLFVLYETVERINICDFKSFLTCRATPQGMTTFKRKGVYLKRLLFYEPKNSLTFP